MYVIMHAYVLRLFFYYFFSLLKGRAYLREKKFWVNLLASIFIGLIIGAFVLAFKIFYTWLNIQTWHSGYDASTMTTLCTGQWWWVGVGAGGGVIVGLLKIIYTYLAEEEFPIKQPSFISELNALECPNHKLPFIVILIAAISIGCGASVGPESAVCLMGSVVGALTARHYGSLVDLREHSEIFILIGISAGFGAVFPSPIMSTLCIQEVTQLMSTAMLKLKDYSTVELVVLTGIAGCSSFSVFTGVRDSTLLAYQQLPAADYNVYDTPGVDTWLKYNVYAIPLGVLCGIVGLIGIFILQLTNELGTFTRIFFNKIGSYFNCPYAFGTFFTPVVGGALSGLVTVIAPLTIGIGNETIEALISHNIAYTIGALLGTCFFKFLATGICLGFGFIGGNMFAYLVAGVSLGLTLFKLIPGVSLIFLVPCCFSAVPCCIIPGIFSVTMLISITLTLGPKATTPVFIASFVSYSTVSGVGIIQNMVIAGRATQEKNCKEYRSKIQCEFSTEASKLGRVQSTRLVIIIL